MKSRLQVAVVVVSFNTRKLLLECIASILDSATKTEMEIIVVDNASSDGSYEAVREAYPDVIAISNSSNRGFGAACNQGIEATTSPFVLLVNSDARLSREAFGALVDLMRAHSRCGAAGCRILNAEGERATNTRNFLTPFNQALELLGLTNKINWRYLRRTHRPTLDKDRVDCSVDWIDGACLMLRRSALDDVGLFDEQFFMYSEDEDLCFRLKEQGWLICFTTAGAVIHHGGASSAQNRHDMLRHYYLSQMMFLYKHRSRASVTLYAWTMNVVLNLKRLLHRLRSSEERSREFAEHSSALRQAFRSRSWER